MFSWWFFVMILTSMYTANLTAYMTINRIDNTISNIKKLPEQSEYKWGMIANRNMETRLLTHVDTKFAEVAKTGVKLKDLDEAITKVREGGFVFIDESKVLDYVFREDCDMVHLVNDMGSSEWSFALPMNSPYLTLMNNKLITYRETEIISQTLIKWYSGESTCGDSTFKSDTPVGLDSISGLFFLAGLCAVICLILVLLEMFYATALDMKSDRKLAFCDALKKRFSFNLRILFNRSVEAKPKVESPGVITNGVSDKKYDI